MLAITRKIGEWVDIPGIGSVVVTKIRGDRVTLAFDFPREIRIGRRELGRLRDTEGESNADDQDEPAS